MSEYKWPDDYIPEGFTPYHIEDAGIIFNCDCREILHNIEISEEYCRIAVKRLRQGVLNFG